MSESGSPSPRDLVSEHFGFVVAYLFPGLLVIGSLAMPFESLRAWLRAAAGVDANLGGFLMMLVVALGVGNFVQAVRWWLFEDLLRGHGWFPAAPREDHSAARSAVVQAELLAIRDNHYRHYQAFGALALAIPFAFACWAVSDLVSTDAALLSTGAMVSGTGLSVRAARDAYGRVVRKREALLAPRRET